MGDRRTSRRSRARGIVAPLAALGLWGCAPGGDLEAPIARAEELREVDSPVLFRALESDSSELRARAALAMGRIQQAGYAEALARASALDELAVRRAALFALGQLGLAEGARPERVAVDACVAAAGDDDPRIVADALQALGKLAPEGIAATITPFLTHADERVREQAAHALFRLRFVPVWRRQAEQPPPLPDASVGDLIRALADESVAVRRAAAHAFARYGQPEALEALAEVTRDPDDWVRVFAVRAIGRSGQADAVATLLAAAGDDSAHVRTETVNAVAALGRAGELPSRLAVDPSFHVRAAVAQALASAQGAASLTRLRELERDPSATVAAAAIESLAARLADAYAGELAEHLADQRWTIRMAAARGARRLEHGHAELLAAARKDAVNSVRLAAFEVLAGLEGGEEILRVGLSAEDLAMRGTAVGLLAQSDAPQRTDLLVETYRASTGGSWVEVRESIVDALAAGGDSEATREILREMARGDSAGSVRRRAAVVLAGWGVEIAAAEPQARKASPFLGRRLEADPIVILETERGEMRLQCLSRAAPIHVASFVERVGAGFYDGLLWHRVVANFVIQGGDPRGDGWGGAGYLLRDEINRVPYERGTVGMPKAGKDTGGGQIFITHLPTPHLDGNYTVFARVIDGEEVIDRIEVGDRIVRARVVGLASE